MGGSLTAWCGNLPLASDDPSFDGAVDLGRKYVDVRARGKPVSAAEYLERIVELRAQTPHDSHVLLDELEHRWAHPDAPPSLYVLTFGLSVKDGYFVAGGENLGMHVISTKVGRAKRSLVGRLALYAEGGIGRGMTIPPGSLTLRVAVFGHGTSMLTESDLKREATLHVRALGRIGGDGRVTSESYEGVAAVEPLSRFVQRCAG